LKVWWSSTAAGNGTNAAAAPTAASSVTVLAAGPANHQVGISKRLRGVVDEWGERGLYAGSGIVGPQLVNLFSPAWCVTSGTLGFRDQREGLGTTVLVRGRPSCRPRPAP